MKKENALAIVDSMNCIMKAKPLAKAVMDEKYDRLLGEINGSGEWGVMVKDMKFVDGQVWCELKLVSADDPEYQAL